MDYLNNESACSGTVVNAFPFDIMFLMNLNYFLGYILPVKYFRQTEFEPNVYIKHNCLQVKMWSVNSIFHNAEYPCFMDCTIAADSLKHNLEFKCWQ